MLKNLWFLLYKSFGRKWVGGKLGYFWVRVVEVKNHLVEEKH